MTLPAGFELATDAQFRELSNFITPPRAGVVTAIEGSGQVRVDTDDPDGGDVLAWPLNDFTYAVDDVVYVHFGVNSPDSAIVLGSKGATPTLSGYIRRSGADTLTGDWGIGEDRRILAEAFRARDGEGLRLEDDAGNLGLMVEDGGEVGVGGITAPEASIHAGGTVNLSAILLENARYLGSKDSSGNHIRIFGMSSANDVYLGAMDALGGKVFIRENGVSIVMVDDGNVGIGLPTSSTPGGKLHVHDGASGLLFVSKTGLVNSSQTIIANGTGDITSGITGFYVLDVAGSAVASAFTMVPTDTLDVVNGGFTMRLTVASNGTFTAIRQAGAGTGSLTILAIWQ